MATQPLQGPESQAETHFVAGHKQALVPDSTPSVRAAPLPKQQYRYLDIKSDETRGTFTSEAESEQRLLYYGQLDRRRHLSLEPSTPQVTHHRQVMPPPNA